MKEGPLNFEGLKRMTSIMISQFEIVGVEFGTRIVSSFFSKLGRPAAIRSSKSRQKKDEPEVDINSECQKLLEEDMIQLNDADLYELTSKGEEQAREFEKNLKKSVKIFERQILSPTAAARNTFITDFFLAVLKLFTGFLSGSVGLIADGADAAIDTISASLVWIGMKMKRELLGTIIILIMMFITGISLGYESAISILEALTGTLSAIARPYLVVLTESIAFLFAVILFIYQRFVGKRNGSLSLISQSVDSKNHIYVAFTVIIGAILSTFGIPFLDALVGGFVAGKILIDAVDLSKETISSIKGEEVDLEKYDVPLEKQWEISKIETFKAWILFSIKEEKITNREELINELEKTFKPKYVPILSEFKFSLGEGFDFKESFDVLSNPLLEENLMTRKDEEYILTDKGNKHISGLTRRVRFQY
jgi:divalent metal cation (Fe/Co/Zn/Cd) transporter/predicted transcriptional regulator